MIIQSTPGISDIKWLELREVAYWGHDCPLVHWGFTATLLCRADVKIRVIEPR